MSDRTATPERELARAKAARRGGPSGRQVVGDYVGQAAADAAQAVRRAGLRSGLDRSFGCEPELIGLVVAQEPEAGSDLARNGMVTLYVAAPGAPVGKDDGPPEALTDELPSVEPAPSVAADVTGVEDVSAPVRVRRRKPGLSGRTPQIVDPPPAPVPPVPEPEGQAPGDASVPTVDLPETWGSPQTGDVPYGEELGEGIADDRSDELAHEDEFVVHVDDVLAGRTGGVPAWRRVYPRRRMASVSGGGSVRGWLAGHRWLARIAVVGVAVCVGISLAATLDGHHAPALTASTVPGRGVRADTRPIRARIRVPAQSVRTAGRTYRPSLVRRGRRGSQREQASRPSEVVAPSRDGSAPSEGAGVKATPAPAQQAPAAVSGPAASSPQPAPPVRVSSSAAPPPAGEQTGGGLFSP